MRARPTRSCIDLAAARQRDDRSLSRLNFGGAYGLRSTRWNPPTFMPRLAAPSVNAAKSLDCRWNAVELPIRTARTRCLRSAAPLSQAADYVALSGFASGTAALRRSNGTKFRCPAGCAGRHPGMIFSPQPPRNSAPIGWMTCVSSSNSTAIIYHVSY